MDRNTKEEWVSSLKHVFKESALIVVTHYNGLTASEMTELRGQIRAAGASFRVTKNRLTRLALDGTKIQWYTDRIKKWEKGERIAPVTVDMALTRSCNYGCHFCYAMTQENDRSVISKEQAGLLKEYNLICDDIINVDDFSQEEVDQIR